MSTLLQNPMYRYKREKTVVMPPHVVFRLLEVKTALAHSVRFVEKGLQRAAWNSLTSSFKAKH